MARGLGDEQLLLPQDAHGVDGLGLFYYMGGEGAVGYFAEVETFPHNFAHASTLPGQKYARSHVVILLQAVYVLNVVPQEVLVPNVVPDGFFDIGPESFLLLLQVSWYFSALCLASS